jgi:hypothetical protein
MTADADDPVCAINLLSLNPGATIEEFKRFSAELDQPTCLAQDVVQGFDAYAISHRAPGAPEFDIVEVMMVRSWSEWERVRDTLAELEPVREAFDRLIAADAVRAVFGTRISPRMSADR